VVSDTGGQAELKPFYPERRNQQLFLFNPLAQTYTLRFLRITLKSPTNQPKVAKRCKMQLTSSFSFSFFLFVVTLPRDHTRTVQS
jgi:hypothetical protein